MTPLIFHCDCNNFFASCECLERPELKDVPMAVAGDPERRTGVVVAKNELAKKYGVKTTDTVWQARQKCPAIVFVPPRRKLYSRISALVNAIYRGYTEYVEPASIDESFLDLTGALSYYRMSERELADSIRARVREEIGITISVGVSFNKVFAKMGSDYKKPDATTVITRENYKEILWPMSVSELLLAGRASVSELEKYGIHTIGELAERPAEFVKAALGRMGETLWAYANGLDTSPVRMWGDRPEIKSVSHGRTFSRDLVTEEEIRAGISELTDAVAVELRRKKKVGSVVGVQLKSPALITISRQMKLERPTDLHHEIRKAAYTIIKAHWDGNPVRAITVFVNELSDADEAGEQLSLFDETNEKREKREKLEAAVALLRDKHGRNSIKLGTDRRPDD